ncbi:hypothetical protein HYS31_03755 [Candidatus Woesearchaeota archaeon]|nr:hypothetical protein [Candidatus Woesearchaeota archaeon]
MRLLILLLIFLGFFAYACTTATEYKYVCPNGAIVSDKTFCENKEPTQKEEPAIEKIKSVVPQKETNTFLVSDSCDFKLKAECEEDGSKVECINRGNNSIVKYTILETEHKIKNDNDCKRLCEINCLTESSEYESHSFSLGEQPTILEVYQNGGYRYKCPSNPCQCTCAKSFSNVEIKSFKIPDETLDVEYDEELYRCKYGDDKKYYKKSEKPVCPNGDAYLYYPQPKNCKQILATDTDCMSSCGRYCNGINFAYKFHYFMKNLTYPYWLGDSKVFCPDNACMCYCMR